MSLSPTPFPLSLKKKINGKYLRLRMSKTLKLDSRQHAGLPQEIRLLNCLDLPREEAGYPHPAPCPRPSQARSGVQRTGGMHNYSPGGVAASATLSSRGLLVPVEDAVMTEELA